MTDLRTTLEAAVELQEKEGPSDEIRTVEVPENKPEGESTTPKVDPTPKDGETTPLDSKSAEVAGKDTPESAKTPVETPKADESGADKPPSSWKAGPKAKWDKLDPEVKAEIRRRERQVDQTVSETAGVRKFAEGFSQTVRPFAARFQEAGVHPLQAIRSLLEIDQVLARGPMAHKAMTIAKLIKDYGVDVAAIDAAISGEDVTQTDPASILDQRIQQAIAPLHQTLQTFTAREQAQARQENEQFAATLEQMSENTEKYPHFDLVRGEMADLIEYKAGKGLYLSLDDAYNQAVRMSPEAQQAEQGLQTTRKAQQQDAAARKALGASLSVSGAPATLRQPVDSNDLRATIEAAVASHSGR